MKKLSGKQKHRTSTMKTSQKPSAFFVQKGGKNYVNIIGTYLSGRAGNGGNLSETEASEDHRNAHHRHCVGTICVGFPGFFHSVNFCGPAENGIDHYTAESRIIAGFE